MKDKDIDFLKTLIIKLDISIEAERNNVSADGLMLIFDFKEKNRKESITKALDILNKTQNKWQKLKEWLDDRMEHYNDCLNENVLISSERQEVLSARYNQCFETIAQMEYIEKELEGEEK